MKKTWHTVWWVVLILFLLGSALMATGLLSGSDTQAILSHGGFTRYLEWLRRAVVPVRQAVDSLLNSIF